VRNLTILNGVELDKRQVFIQLGSRRDSIVKEHHIIIKVVIRGESKVCSVMSYDLGKSVLVHVYLEAMTRGRVSQ
jgi:hypothetical protein